MEAIDARGLQEMAAKDAKDNQDSAIDVHDLQEVEGKYAKENQDSVKFEESIVHQIHADLDRCLQEMEAIDAAESSPTRQLLPVKGSPQYHQAPIYVVSLPV